MARLSLIFRAPTAVGNGEEDVVPAAVPAGLSAIPNLSLAMRPMISARPISAMVGLRVTAGFV